MQGIHRDLSLKSQNRVIAISQPWVGALCPSGWYGSAKHSIDLNQQVSFQHTKLS